MQFPEVMRHGRFLFDTDIEYAGRLVGITERSIENEAADLALLRLEFEIFVIDQESQPPRLLATACIASRDIIVTPSAKSDPKLVRYSDLLGMKDVKSKESWYAMEQLASAGKPKWIRIKFGPPDEVDLRQQFSVIRKLELSEFTVIESEASTLHRGTFVKVSQVVRLLRNENNEIPSDDTVNRFVDRFKDKYGERLVQRVGRQRQINWHLCWHLWEAERVG